MSSKRESKDLKDIIARLNERLDEPFVTVNTVTGDKGIKQAQDEYQRLMNNKSPKNKENRESYYIFAAKRTK